MTRALFALVALVACADPAAPVTPPESAADTSCVITVDTLPGGLLRVRRSAGCATPAPWRAAP